MNRILHYQSLEEFRDGTYIMDFDEDFIYVYHLTGKFENVICLVQIIEK
jgi:hypothetical protein